MAGTQHEPRRATRIIGRWARWTRRHLAWWILAAGAVDTALITLAGVLISLPGQSGKTISGLLVVLLVLLALSIAFPVAGRIVEDRDRKAAQERKRRERADQLLRVDGSAGRLPRLSEVSNVDLGATSTRYSKDDAAPYVRRDKADKAIRGLLAKPGPPYPFVIVWGPTKAGKSRTLAEALHATFGDDDPVVVLPLNGRALAELAGLGIDDLIDHRPAVVMLDDLDPAGLEALTTAALKRVRSWAVIAATMTAQRRADVLNTGSPVGAIARAALDAASGEYELTSEPPVGTERAEAERLYPAERFDGSIAETLVGARELIARYKAGPNENPAGCAVVRAAIDIRRAGLSRPVTDAELRRLFPLYLRALRIDLAPTNEQFAAGINWAARPVTSQVALLRPASPRCEPPAWVAFDHAVTADDEGHGRQARPIPAETWTELVDMLPQQDLFPVGMAASAAGRDETAIIVFRKVLDSGPSDWVALAAVGLGNLLSEHGDFEGARAALRRAIDSGHPDAAPIAALGLGTLLEAEGDVKGARAVYQVAIDSGRADIVSTAAVGLGTLVGVEGDVKGARAAFQLAIDSGHADQSARAELRLGNVLRDQGDQDGARAAYQIAVDSGQADVQPVAALNLGDLLRDQGNMAGARAAYQVAIDSGRADIVPAAGLGLGALLSEEGDVTGARAAYQRAIDSKNADAAPSAALGLGHLLVEHGDLDGARAAFQQAIDSGHANVAPLANLNLGGLLWKQGDMEGARAAFQRAIDSGHADAAPMAALSLGVQLTKQGDVAGARVAYQLAIDSRHANATPAARQRLKKLA